MNRKIKILITGANGFIGSAIIKQLLFKKYKLLAITKKKQQNTKNIQWVVSDLELNNLAIDKISNFQPEIIFHLAWEKIPDFSKKTCDINYKKNIFFLKKILKIKSVKKIIVSGSCFEYLLKKGKKKENNNIDTINNFPKTKNLILNFLKKNCNKNQKFAWFRIFYAYGPGQREGSLIPYLRKAINQNKEIEIKTPYVENDYIYIDDIARVFIRSININFNSGIFNLGSGIKIKTINIIKMIEKIKNKKFKIKQNNKDNKKSYSFYADMNKTKKKFNINNLTSFFNGLKKTLSMK